MKWTMRTLFMRRVNRHWSGQYRLWRSALDWTVWLYILIPGLLFAIGTYRAWWHYPPEWLTGLPDPLAAILPLIAALSGRLRVFTEDADALFLRQRPSWMKGLTGLGIAYSFIIHLIIASSLFGLLTIWLVHLMGLTIEQTVWWAAFTAGCRMTYGIVKHLIGARWNGWRKYVVLGLAGAVTIAAFLLPSLSFLSTRHSGIVEIAAVLSWMALAAAAAIKLQSRGSFWHDVWMERKAQLASTDFLLSSSMERKPRVQLRQPILYRHSGRIFRRKDDAGTILAEMRMKSFLRKGANLQLWLSFIGISSTAVWMTPAWLSLPIAFVLPAIAAIWLRDQWKEWFSESFLRQFQWGEQETRIGSSSSQFWLLVPSASWLAGLAGWILAGAWGFAAALALGILIWSQVHKLLAKRPAV